MNNLSNIPTGHVLAFLPVSCRLILPKTGHESIDLYSTLCLLSCIGEGEDVHGT